MKTMMKIALTFILIIGLSASVYAADDDAAAGGDAITIASTDTARPALVFTPSGNTIMVQATTTTAYYIGSASAKTTAANGLEYCMVSGTTGFYQKAQTGDGTITAVGTPGTAPSDWANMGGGS